MYNTDLPTRAELPTSSQLLRSTAIAFVSAVAILVTIVLPAEYAIDPTGVGKALRLTEMGQIKTQLANEAEQDRLLELQKQNNPAAPAPEKQSGLFGSIFANLVIGSANAQAATRSDETVITLKPNEGVEYKLTMRAGAKVNFAWTSTGPVNADLHGTDPAGSKEKSFKLIRSVTKDEGVLAPEIDGVQGWFFRNRGSSDVTIILKTNGAYGEIKRMV